MDTSVVRRSIPLLQYSLKSWYVGNRDTRRSQHSTVDLAHKVYGNIDGDAPIIILHGLMGSKKNWDSMSQKLKSAVDRTVIAVDARNHGESPRSLKHTYYDLAADVKQLMKKLRIKEAIVLGHSMGGRTAMVLALTKPSIVSHLIVVDISPVTSPSVLNDFFPRLMDVMKSIHFDNVKDLPSAREMARHILQTSKLNMDHGTINFVLMNVVKKDNRFTWMVNVEVLRKYFTTIATFPLDIAGKTYGGPTLFIAGEKSHFVPVTDLSGIQGMFPLAEVEYVEDAGHNVHIDKPDDFLDLVTNFITKYST